MRCDDDAALLPAHQVRGTARECGERVRVEHERRRGSVEQRTHEIGDRRTTAQSGPAGNHVVLELEQRIDGGRHDRAVAGFRQWLRHELGRHRGHDRQARGRRRQGDEPGARSQSACRRQVGRSGLASRPGHDRDAPEVSLVRLRSAWLDQHVDLFRREQLDLRAVQALQYVRRDADVGYQHVAGVSLARWQHERQFRRRQRHGHRRVDAVSHQMRRVRRHSAWQVNRHDGDAGGVDVRNDRFHHPAKRGFQSGAKDGVNQERATARSPRSAVPTSVRR